MHYKCAFSYVIYFWSILPCLDLKGEGDHLCSVRKLLTTKICYLLIYLIKIFILKTCYVYSKNIHQGSATPPTLSVHCAIVSSTMPPPNMWGTLHDYYLPHMTKGYLFRGTYFQIIKLKLPYNYLTL